MTATVTSIATHDRYAHQRELPIARAELAKKLVPNATLSKTTIYKLISAGMPVLERDPAGNRFLLSQCRAWLAANGGTVAAAVRVDRGYAITPTAGGTYA
jgi:hypothetical protein